jgi:hypothetical protein
MDKKFNKNFFSKPYRMHCGMNLAFFSTGYNVNDLPVLEVL